MADGVLIVLPGRHGGWTMGRMTSPVRMPGRISWSAWVCYAVVCTAAALTGGCRARGEAGDGEIILRLSHITAPQSSWDHGARVFAHHLKIASRKAGGPTIRVRVFPGGRLALRNQETELQMLRSGAIDMALVSPIILGLYVDKRFDAYSLPWLFRDHAQARAVCDGPFGTESLGWLTEQGMVGLAWGVNGFRQLTNSKRSVRTPADLAGMKVRVAGSEIFLETFRALGAQPLTMNFGEVLTALEQGVIDSQENPLSIIESSRLYECQAHVTIWNYAYDPLILIVNAKRWGSFTPAQQAMVKQCAKQGMDAQRELVEEDDRTVPQRLADRGMTVARLSASERQAFERKVQSIYEKFRSRIGAAVVDRIVEATRTAASRPATSSTAPATE